MRDRTLRSLPALAHVLRSVAWPSASRHSHRSMRFARLELEGVRSRIEQIAALRTAALLATFRRAAPRRCGAFADERRFAAGDEAAECVIDERARPWPRRSPRALRCGARRAPRRPRFPPPD